MKDNNREKNGKNNADKTKTTNNIQSVEEQVKTIITNTHAHMYKKNEKEKNIQSMHTNERT